MERSSGGVAYDLLFFSLLVFACIVINTWQLATAPLRWMVSWPSDQGEMKSAGIESRHSGHDSGVGGLRPTAGEVKYLSEWYMQVMREFLASEFPSG